MVLSTHSLITGGISMVTTASADPRYPIISIIPWFSPGAGHFFNYFFECSLSTLGGYSEKRLNTGIAMLPCMYHCPQPLMRDTVKIVFKIL